jgi:hypothetical protein
LRFPCRVSRAGREGGTAQQDHQGQRPDHLRWGQPGHLPRSPVAPPNDPNPDPHQKSTSLGAEAQKKKKPTAAAAAEPKKKKPREEVLRRGAGAAQPAEQPGAAAAQPGRGVGGAESAEQAVQKPPARLRLAQLAKSRARVRKGQQRKRITLVKTILEKEPGTLTTAEQAYVNELLNGPDDKKMGRSTLAKWRARLPNGGVLGPPRAHRGRPVLCGRCWQPGCKACARAVERERERERASQRPSPARVGQRSVRVAQRRDAQPGVGSVVDVLYHVHGKPAYFRGTVRRVQNVGQVLTITTAFERQTHYGLTFPAETTSMAWKAGVVRVVLTL